jgi:hypothetical protein
MPRGKKAIDLTGQRFGRLTALQRTATYITGRKPMWRCKCDCGKETLAISQCLVNGTTQSCGCLREEFLTLGPMAAKTLGRRPQAVKITYPIPENLHPNPFVNEVMRRMTQYRWERVEHESRKIERGHRWESLWIKPKKEPFTPRDDFGNRIEKLDLRALAKEKQRAWQDSLKAPVAGVPASFCTGSSLADRIRIVSDEEWERL